MKVFAGALLINANMTSLIGAFRVNVKALRKCTGTSDTSATNSYKPELHYTKSTATMYASENQIIKKGTIFGSHQKTLYHNYRTHGKDWIYIYIYIYIHKILVGKTEERDDLDNLRVEKETL